MVTVGVPQPGITCLVSLLAVQRSALSGKVLHRRAGERGLKVTVISHETNTISHFSLQSFQTCVQIRVRVKVRVGVRVKARVKVRVRVRVRVRVKIRIAVKLRA